MLRLSTRLHTANKNLNQVIDQINSEKSKCYEGEGRWGENNFRECNALGAPLRSLKTYAESNEVSSNFLISAVWMYGAHAAKDWAKENLPKADSTKITQDPNSVALN